MREQERWLAGLAKRPYLSLKHEEASLNEIPASDWSAARGKKWLAQLESLEAMLAPVDAPLIEALDLHAPCRIADIACGGGGTTLKIHRRAPSGSCVHGFDISPDLIERAQSRLGEEPIEDSRTEDGRLAFMVADLQTASPPAEPYELLVSRFGIMFFDEPDRAFANLASWLGAGGRFAFAVWGPPADNPWMTSIRDAVEALVDLPPPDPDAPGPFRYAGEKKLLALLDGAGLTGLEVSDWHGQLRHGGGLPADEAAAFALRSFSIAEPLSDAGDDVFAEGRRLLAARFAEFEHGGAVCMDARVHIVTGARV